MRSIDRESVEDASDVTASVARADCAHLQHDLSVIVVANLPLDEAKTFQAELTRGGFAPGKLDLVEALKVAVQNLYPEVNLPSVHGVPLLH